MAKVRLRMFRASFPTDATVVQEGSHHPSIRTIRLGRWYPPTLQDFGPRLHLFVLRYRLCFGLVIAELGACRSIQRCPRHVLPLFMECLPGLYVHLSISAGGDQRLTRQVLSFSRVYRTSHQPSSNIVSMPTRSVTPWSVISK